MEEKRSRFARVRGWYQKFERPISSLSLIGGFVFDALTLTRVDIFWDNFWVGAHLLIVAVSIVLANATEGGEVDVEDPGKLHFWLVNVMQFFFGGLLSTYLVFYFRSGTIGVSWPFFAILAIAFIANERLKHHYARLAFQISILYLSVYLFCIYIIPVIVHAIGAWVFILSGVASLVVIGLFLLLLRATSKERFVNKGGRRVILFVVGIFAMMNIFYFTNILPPIPLSVKDAGLYETFTVNAPGNYTAQYEDQGWLGFLDPSDTIRLTPGAALFAYSAVFSPTSFNVNIVHEWQYYNASSSQWITRGKITLPVTGGADSGYRTFSEEEGLGAGAWRVDIETTQGQVIGRIGFNVIIVSSTPTLSTREID
ncbi:MAG TPA: DUF2914 domain-containing protein [Candidatus Paceibacterota bacterium]|nr:DUF2914 domain-containing protein [Candidatus Paceibacterota bacterium]